MRSTGIVRKVDDLGRIVMPVELRRVLGIDIRDAVEVFVDADKIVLRKYAPACVFCGEAEDVSPYKGKKVCASCAKQLTCLIL